MVDSCTIVIVVASPLLWADSGPTAIGFQICIKVFVQQKTHLSSPSLFFKQPTAAISDFCDFSYFEIINKDGPKRME